jgi:hypothetical protein
MQRQRLRATAAETDADQQRAKNIQQETQLRLIVQNLLRSGMTIEQVAEMTGMAIEAVRLHLD